MKRALLAGTLVVLAGVAITQPLVTPTLVGTEVVTVSVGPGGQGFFATINQIRNTNGVLVLGPGVSGNVAGTVNTSSTLVNTQPTLTTTFITPASPVPDGFNFQVCNVTAVAWVTTVITMTPNTGQTIQGGNVTLTTLGANTCAELQYQLSNTTWYRIR